VLSESQRHRLQGLVRIVEKELRHLMSTDARLFAEPFTAERARRLEEDPDLAERVEAFVSRFGRLQDTLGDKLLPRYLQAVGERPAPFIDNLLKAERLGLIPDAERWLDLRKLRNRMVHEYIEDPEVLAPALQEGHRAVAELAQAARNLIEAIRARGWV